MKLTGIINLFGNDRPAIMIIDDDQEMRGVSPYRNNKWRATITESGKQHHIGYYDHRADAVEAVKARRNLAQFRRPFLNMAGRWLKRDDAGRWLVSVNGVQAVRSTFGEAVLLVDALAARFGASTSPMVHGYTMPLSLIREDDVLRHFNEPVFAPTAAERETYRQHVERLNRGTYAP